MSAREVIAVVLIGTPHSNPVTQADAILAALSAAGFAVLPVEPTEAMVWNGASSYDHPSVFMGGPSHRGRRASERIWRAMLAAAQEDSTDGR